MTQPKTLEKREWVYVLPPSRYSMAGCACGNQETEWSEFKEHLWCSKCQVDFIPEHPGIFDGPIPVGLCLLMGIVFDRYIIATGKVEVNPLEPDESKETT